MFRRRRARRAVKRGRRVLETKGGYQGSGSAEEARPPRRLPSAARRLPPPHSGYRGGQVEAPNSEQPPMSDRPPPPPGRGGGSPPPTVRVEVADAQHSPHSSPSPCCWVPVFVDWAEGRQESLDFGGKEIPERVRVLLETAMGPARR